MNMLEFITTLLLLLFAVKGDALPPEVKDNIVSKLQQTNLSEVSIAENMPVDKILIYLTPTPTSEIQFDSNSSNSNIQNENDQKIPAYNEKSDHPVGEVAAKAVENAEPLIECAEDLCSQPSPVPTDPPGPSPTLPVPTLKPSITPIPTTTIEPPITPIPLPPIDPCGCGGGGKLPCPMVYYCKSIQ